MLRLKSKVIVIDNGSKYFGEVGTVLGVQFGLVSDIYTVEITLSFRSIIEDFDEDQLGPHGSDKFRMFEVGDRVTVTSKERKHKGSSGVVTAVPDNDNVVYVRMDEDSGTTWYFERELVKEPSNS